MSRVAPNIALNSETETRLQRLALAPSTSQGLVLRVRIVLAAAAGETNRQIARRLKVPEVTVGKWRRAFAARGLDGLKDAERPGRPSKYTAEDRRKVEQRVRQEPEYKSRWSVRMLAGDLGMPRSTVHAILAASGLRPHRAQIFSVSGDPDFHAKLLSIAGIYLDPPAKACVLSVDENAGFGARDRFQPRPLRRVGKQRRRAGRYRGTLPLMAALEAAGGEVVPRDKRDRTPGEFFDFMDTVTADFPQSDLHVIAHHLDMHQNEAAEHWLESHRRVHFHPTPTRTAWVHLMECFFSILSKESQGAHGPRALAEQLIQFIANQTKSRSSFIWIRRGH